MRNLNGKSRDTDIVVLKSPLQLDLKALDFALGRLALNV